MIGVPVMGPAAGTVALPLPYTGWGMPAIEGGTGAGWIGGVPLDTVSLRNGGAAASGDDDVLPVSDDEPGLAGLQQRRAGRIDELPAEPIRRAAACERPDRRIGVSGRALPCPERFDVVVVALEVRNEGVRRRRRRASAF